MQSTNNQQLFTEISAQEAVAINGGNWKQWWDRSKPIRVAFQIATGSILIPYSLGVNIANKILYPSGPIV